MLRMVKIHTIVLQVFGHKSQSTGHVQLCKEINKIHPDLNISASYFMVIYATVVWKQKDQSHAICSFTKSFTLDL